MKKTLKSQVMVAVAMLVVAAVALSSVTYAWFTTVSNPMVTSIDLYVKAEDSLFLSALMAPVKEQSDNWSSIITYNDIIGVGSPTLGDQPYVFPAELTNVSTALTGTSPYIYRPDAVNATTGLPTTFKAALAPYNDAGDTKGDYVRFSLWIKSTRAGCIYLSGNASGVDQASVGSYVVPKNGATPSSSGTQTNIFGTGGPFNKPEHGIAYTTRVAFVPADGGGNPVFAESVIWEPNSLKHLDSIYGGPVSPPATKMPTNARTGTVPGSSITTGLQTTYDFGIVGATGTGTSSAQKIALFDLDEETPQQFFVYIWVEGVDADTVNEAAKHWFATNIKFGQETDKDFDDCLIW